MFKIKRKPRYRVQTFGQNTWHDIKPEKFKVYAFNSFDNAVSYAEHWARQWDNPTRIIEHNSALCLKVVYPWFGKVKNNAK